MDSDFSFRRFGWAVSAFLAVLAAGTVVYHALTTEGWVESFYRSVVTVTLTGIDSRPPGPGAQLFTIALLLAGVAIFLYVAGTIVELIARGVLTGAWADRRRRRTIERLRDHYIICGYGRVGRRVGQVFREAGVEYVVLDFNPEALEHARENGVRNIEGSGTDDADLEAAGLSRARGLIAASDSDVDNLYITLSARAARPDLQIVARASNQDVARKLDRAGADRVVQPYTTAGEEMAKLMLRPQVAAFLEMVTAHGGPDLSFEEIEVTPTCRQAGRTIRELRVRAETGALIVALRKTDGTFDTTPDPDAVLEAGDVMIAMGTDSELRLLEELFAPREAVPARAQALAELEARLAGLAEAPVELERPTKSEHGDYATNVALRTAPTRGRPPREVARELAERFAGAPEVARAEVAGPGFVNLWLEDAWFGAALAEILDAGQDFGARSVEPRERIQVELVSANPTGPLTVGSARNAAYGDSVARLLAFAGHDVEREYYFNDVGRQIDLFRESVEARRRGEQPPEEGYQGAYIADLARREGDPVALMLREIQDELAAFRVPVDTWERQQEVERDVPAVLPLLDTHEAEGTLWARTSAYGDDKDRPLIRSSDGSYLYFAADVAYVRNKLERGFDRAIYVLGADHHGYVRRLQAAAAMLGYDPERVEVLIYQLVHVVEHGEAKRVSKRRGDVVFLSELVDRVGVDAARWYLVSRGHDQTIEIDVDLAAEQSQKNPVYYVQYAHARIAGIMRNAAGGGAGAAAEPRVALAPEERDLVKRLVEFPDVAAEAAQRRGPHALPTYSIRVADEFHRFYHQHRVLGSGDAEPFRLGLAGATGVVIARSLDLVGVSAPDRM